MTLAAHVLLEVQSTKTAQHGVAASVESHPLTVSVSVGDCTKVWSDRRTIAAAGYDDVDLLSLAGISTVKFFCIKNLSSSDMAMSAGYNGTDFRNFMSDSLAWNFSPMVNLGSLTLRGLPIRAGGSYMLSCPNTVGLATTSGGSRVRVGGISGAQYEIYVIGT